MDGLVVTRPRWWGLTSNPPGATFGPRQLKDYELVWMVAGDAVYECDGARFDAPEGAVVLCRPGTTDGFIWDQKRGSQHGFVHFDITTPPEGPPGWPAPAQWPTVRMLTAEDVYPTLFRHLLTHVETGPAWLVRLTLMELLAVFVTGCTAASPLPASGRSEPVQAVIDFVHRQLEEDTTRPITLDDLATAACVTPAHLCRLFKRDTGRTPLEMVRLARLDLAATRLVRSNEPVGRIAEACGFASPFHFSRRFSEAFGLSPSALRKQVRLGKAPPLPRLASRTTLRSRG